MSSQLSLQLPSSFFQITVPILHRKYNAEAEAMKSATFPSLRVDPELRKAAESVLRDHESLSSFLEEAIRASIELRRNQQAFLERGLAARTEAQDTGEYYSADAVQQELDTLLAVAESRGDYQK
jgi:predicted transcriptional regulator